jgi:hypothetical protein
MNAPQGGWRVGDFEVDLEAMNKTPLREKGKKGDGTKKKKKTKSTEKETDIKGSTKKKATFAETRKEGTLAHCCLP